MERFHVNEKFADKQGISEENRNLLEELYILLEDILFHPEQYDNPVERIEDIEFRMQYLWKFEKDPTRHRYWLDIKGCECPKIDNYERIGTPYRIIVTSCPWHGGFK